MASRAIAVDDLSAEERIALMGRLWDSLDPSVAAPVTEALAAELERRELEADADPSSGDSWSSLKRDLDRSIATPTRHMTGWRDKPTSLRAATAPWRPSLV